MTDKQIIVDGVDVSGCEWYKQGATGMICADYNKSNDCSKNPNCSYKNWQRKEQECEELKEKLIKWLGKEGLRQSDKEFYEQQLDQFKAENDKLKVRNIKYMNGNISYQLKNSLYKQTLTEIKEIAEHCIKQDICTICDNSEKCHIEDEEIPTYDVCKLILQKISECDGNDETN